MKDKVEIKKVVINIGGKELNLTVEEAKELRDLLNGTFGEKETIYIPQYPVYPDNPYYPWRYWKVDWQYCPTITVSNTSCTDGTMYISYNVPK